LKAKASKQSELLEKLKDEKSKMRRKVEIQKEEQADLEKDYEKEKPFHSVFDDESFNFGYDI